MPSVFDKLKRASRVGGETDREQSPRRAVLWFAYPKGTSKRYASDINRDAGWDALKYAGLETVRLIAIDEDWSALRFRRTKYVAGKKAAR